LAKPGDPDARLFYRCAVERFGDAQVLLKADHTTGAVYLAGYAVECMLKSLVLMAVPNPDRPAMLRSFRGQRAHDFGWLRTQYYLHDGPRFPRDTNEAFTLVNDWSTDLRYLPRKLHLSEADGFLSAAGNIMRLADGRL
jgi:hypothetical protein